MRDLIGSFSLESPNTVTLYNTALKSKRFQIDDVSNTASLWIPLSLNSLPLIISPFTHASNNNASTILIFVFCRLTTTYYFYSCLSHIQIPTSFYPSRPINALIQPFFSPSLSHLMFSLLSLPSLNSTAYIFAPLHISSIPWPSCVLFYYLGKTSLWLNLLQTYHCSWMWLEEKSHTDSSHFKFMTTNLKGLLKPPDNHTIFPCFRHSPTLLNNFIPSPFSTNLHYLLLPTLTFSWALWFLIHWE